MHINHFHNAINSQHIVSQNKSTLFCRHTIPVWKLSYFISNLNEIRCVNICGWFLQRNGNNLHCVSNYTFLNVYSILLFERWILLSLFWLPAQTAKFMGPIWGPPGSCRPQMGPMLAPWTLLSRRTTKNSRPICRYTLVTQIWYKETLWPGAIYQHSHNRFHHCYCRTATYIAIFIPVCPA